MWENRVKLLLYKIIKKLHTLYQRTYENKLNLVHAHVGMDRSSQSTRAYNLAYDKSG